MTSRRDFLKVSLLASGALGIGFRLGAAEDPVPFQPNAWIRIERDGKVVLVVGKSEMGQGVRTSLPMILAEELEVDLASVRLEQAQPGPLFQRLGTGGSTSIMTSWVGLRKAGAAAREMLVAAAAERWGVDPTTCRAEKGKVLHPGSGRALGYAELTAAAAKRKAPEEPRVKKPEQRTLVGTSVKRLDGPGIVRGRAVYGIDIHVPGMLYAVLIRPPVVGASLQAFDAEKAKQVPGVHAVVETSRGLAVVAESTWTAMKARELVKTTWSEAPSRTFNSPAHTKALQEAAKTRGITTLKTGEGLAAFEGAPKKLEAEYFYPFAAHAPVEPMNCTASVKDGRCKLWAPTQSPNRLQQQVAQLLGLKPEEVTVHVTLMGGGFGRRLNHDFGVEAAEVSKKVGRPVQLVWSRTDDTRYGHLQPASVHRLYAGIDGKGRLVAWGHRKASTLHNMNGEPSAEQKRDPVRLRGASWGVYDVPYAIPNIETFHVPVDAPARLGPWRAVYAPSSVFARESFLDEVAHALHKDPVAFRLELLGEGAAPGAIAPTVQMGDLTLDRERLRRVIRLAAEKGGWGKPVAPGRALGFACNIFEGGTATAYVVEVSKASGGMPFQIHRVVAAVDCGVVVNPIGIAQQVEGGVLWGLSNLKSELTFKGGEVVQSGYSDFEVARYGETPAIETHIVPSHGDAPTGLGEPAVLPLPPAVAGALFGLTGKRYRSLPIRSL